MNPIPQTQPTLCIQALKDSLDRYGRVRAGWLFSQIDKTAMLAGEQLTQGPVAAVSINAFQLQVPLHYGDNVIFYADCLRRGKRSLVLKVMVFAERSDQSMVAVTEVIVTYVAVDSQGKARQIP